jgi:beta-galactosidase
MKYLGCAYYPEYWGRERFEEDARLMAEAGINLARIVIPEWQAHRPVSGEFVWSRMEVEEGCFDLGWLHECIDTLERYGVKVLACTPTAAPPAWLTSAYPDTCAVRADGSRLSHGARRHY